MTPERWAEIKQVLDQLLAHDDASREAYVRALPEGVRRDVAEFLAANAEPFDALLPTRLGATTQVESEVLAGRYRIERPLGRGGMGTVDLAHDRVLDCPVAIKRLRNAWLEDVNARRRLLHEGRALAALNHPRIARVQDVLDTPPVLVMEYVAGLPLPEWLAERQPASDVLRVLRHIVEASAYMHAKGVVHCDLKPANVIIDTEGRAKVVDFGIALMVTRPATTALGGTEHTRPPAFTPKYAAPEVIRGSTPTPASDVYSLGVTIEEVLAGCLNAGAPLPPHLQSRLLHVAIRARAEVPAERFRDAGELLRALPPPGSESVSRSTHWRALATTGLIVAAGCLSGLLLVGDGSGRVAAASVPVIGVVTRVDPASASSLSAAAADLLRQSFGPMKRVRLATGEVPALKGTDAALIRELADEGLTHVLVPTVSSTGSGLRLSIKVLRVSDGTVVHSTTRYGAGTALPALAAEAAADLKTWFGEAPASPREQAPQPSVAVLARYSQARQYAERPDIPGNLERSRELLASVVASEPGFTLAHVELARIYLLLFRSSGDAAQLSAAEGSVVIALSQGRELPEVRLVLASVLQARGQRIAALSEVRRVLGEQPDNDQAMRMLGRLEAASGHGDAAEQLLRAAIQIRPSWANIRALGMIQFERGRYGQAAETFKELASIQPDNPWGFQMAGAAYQMDGRSDEAAAQYRLSIGIRPTASAVSNLATIEYERGAYAEAVRLYRQSMQLSPNDPVLVRNLGDAQRRLGASAAAEEAYRTSLELSRVLLQATPTDPDAHATLAYSNARLHACEEANQYAASTRRHASDSLVHLGVAASAYVLCDRLDAAASIITAIRDAGSDPVRHLEDDVVATLRASERHAQLLDQRPEVR